MAQTNTAQQLILVNQHVRVGVGVLIQDPLEPHKLFAGIRKNSHGAGTLALPGGHLELFECWEDCAKREALEETGLMIENVRFCHVTNDIMIEEQKHYITIFMMATCVDSQSRPQNLEPHKCDGWDSYSWQDFKDILEGTYPDPLSLFGPLRNLVLESPEALTKFLQK